MESNQVEGRARLSQICSGKMLESKWDRAACGSGDKFSEVSQVQSINEKCFMQYLVNSKCSFHHLLFFLFVLLFVVGQMERSHSFIMALAMTPDLHISVASLNSIYGGFYNQ